MENTTTECDLRDHLGFECSSSDFQNDLNIDDTYIGEQYKRINEFFKGTIDEELGVMLVGEYQQLVEDNKILDEKLLNLTQHG